MASVCFTNLSHECITKPRVKTETNFETEDDRPSQDKLEHENKHSHCQSVRKREMMIQWLRLHHLAGALFGYGVSRCLLTSTHEAVYLEQIYFNKVLLGQYNSTSGNFTGYTKIAKEVADDLNKNPSFLKQEQKNVETCKTKMPPAVELLSKPVEPYVKLRSVQTVSSRHPGMLLCSAYNFYPKQIRVTWLRDGKMVTSDVTSSDELSNGNWLYQIHSYLEYAPRPGEKITCMVEHASLKEPTLYDWDRVLVPSS